MAQVTQQLTLDVSKENRIQAVVAKQYDYQSRYLKIQFTNQDVPLTIEQGSVVTINALRADNQAKAFLGTVEPDGQVTVPITSFMLELDDKVRCDVSVVDAAGRKLTSMSFSIEVQRASYSGDDISEDENTDLLLQLLEQVAGVETDIESAEAARVTAEDARVAAENIRQQNEQQRQQAFKILYIAYSSSSDGANFTTDWTEGQNYIGIATAQEEPESPSEYTWTRIADLVNVVQEEGSSTSDAMSQKAVTDALRKNSPHYTARWDKSLAQLTRMGSAAGITTNTENFGYFGSVNASYENPFDNIYPWSGIRLCNIDLEKYQYLSSDQSLTECVVAWEGDDSFSYEHQNGVWRYRPEFWGKSWDDGTYRYFDVTDKPAGGYVHYPESIGGRWHGRAVSETINGEPTTCLLPLTGIPAGRTPLSTLHTYAKNYGATLDSIYSIDADTLLFVVEYATMNSQSAIGNGVSNLYRQSSDQIAEAATNSTVVKVLASAGTDYCIPGAIFDIGATNGGNEVGSYYVVSAQADSDPTYLDVTLNAAVTVTRDNYWSVHGLTNQADASIGSKSGYIGTNGKCNAYYRGMVLYGNMSFYTLGVYENHDNQHIWIATSDEQADEYDALDTSAHLDTGIVLSTNGGYIQTLGMLSRSGMLSIPPFCTAIGGNNTNPVGDGTANIEPNNNTVLGFGGGANLSLNCGTLYTRFDITQLSASTAMSARPRLKPPRIRVVGTTLIL